MSIDDLPTRFPTLPDELLNYAESLGHGELHIRMDKNTGLKAIISIHNTNLGPALGGCRFIEYKNVSEAIYDAMRLARGMSYKSAISHLPLGGGKAVIIKPKYFDREKLFESFGEFINTLGGRYITAVDSGSSTSDMDIVRRKTPYVMSFSRPDGHLGDPAVPTSYGLFQGMRAAVKYQLGTDSFHGIHVAIQGAGKVGYLLSKHLHAAGAKITICDVDPANAERCAKEFGATVVSPESIFLVPCDVFAPCALGAVLNEYTIPLLKCKIVAGSANNQLQDPEDGQRLADRGIFYAPDYVINAGGIIDVCWTYYNESQERIKRELERIYDTVLKIAQASHEQQMAPALMADAMALRILNGEDPL